jgi:hypothetical protein
MFKRFCAAIASVFARGFWNDADGWSLADVVVVLVMPIWMYVAVKLALAQELSGNQVDFFLVVSYPLLIAVGGKAVSNLPLPWLRRSGLEPIGTPYRQYPDVPPSAEGYAGSDGRSEI